MSKKVLMIATYGDFFAAFETNNIKILNDMGYEVHLCANWIDTKYNYKHEKLEGIKFKKIHLNFERSPKSFENLKNLNSLYRLMKKESYDLVDCHNAVIGVYARIIAKISGVKKIMYTAHGFQFYKHGPIKDWIIYYPIEYLLSFITDVLIVINKEDYKLSEKFGTKDVRYIPGVGFDYFKFQEKSSEKEIKSLKQQLGLKKSDFIIISVGELSERKNHKSVISALAKIDYNNIHYLLVGQGDQKEKLINQVKKEKLVNRVHILGHRDDVKILNEISDVAVFLSLREGLGIAALESMAIGLPLISSGVQGIRDYSIDGYTGYVTDPKDINQISLAIKKLYENKKLYSEYSLHAKEIAKNFSIYEVNKIMTKIYQEVLKGEA